jgi:hypothetical protein
LICFAILAHENEEALSEQIKNIQCFNPNSKIVLYNGGTNKEFGVNQNIPVCPYSRPLRWGNITPYFFDIMKWLEETKAEYDFLVNLDNDVLFIKPGFEQFLGKAMRFYDCMGTYLQTHYSPNNSGLWFPGTTMWREWDKWKSFFQINYFCSYFNPGQVYRHSIVKKMLSGIDTAKLENLWTNTNVFALEEIFFITLAISKGAIYRGYPWSLEEGKNYVFFGDSIGIDKIKEALNKPNFYWIHPIKGRLLIEANKALMEIYSKGR